MAAFFLSGLGITREEGKDEMVEGLPQLMFLLPKQITTTIIHLQ